ncbi:hypothetical protein CHS0354_011510 [Potamilus streckersoni]|uniref:Carbonyl reductase n=1 Tax=Potamilus streckersoni TaxID=2493646 RepID=A0AAE0SLT4_9BIVA|nr:hypothetical protein CHS0354_011510 [Potamilus streckersoni]
MPNKVAIVTGANRGIGFAVVRRLLHEFHGDVYLTARNTEKGQAACKKLQQEGLNPLFHELDITQPASIRMLQEFITEKYGGVDVLVNNAAVLFDKDTKAPFMRQVEQTVETNFKGTLTMCRIFLPLMRPHSRVIIMSSETGKLKYLGEAVRSKIDLNTIGLYDLDKLVDQYTTAVKTGALKKYGWPEQPSQVMYTFQNLMAKVLTRELKDDPRRNVLINACCPGWTITDSTKSYLDGNGCLGDVRPRTPDEAAADVVWLAMLPPGTPKPNAELVQFRKTIDFIS